MATPTTKLVVPPADFKTELTPAPAAATMKSAEAKKGDLWQVPIGSIKILPDFNVRVRDTDAYKAGITELKDSIVANGYYPHKPLAGYTAKVGDDTIIYLEDGHRRLEAVEAANFELGADAQITSLPVIVAPAATTMEDMLVNLVQSNSGKDLTPYEKGLVVKRLLGFGMDKKQVAARLGFTPRYIDDMLVLVAAPVAVRNLMLNDRISSTQALRELRKDPAKAAERLTAAVKAAEGAGKTKATAKDTARAAGGAPAVKMQRINLLVNFGKGDVMGSVLKVLAGQLRAQTPHAADDTDLILVDGSITVALSIPEPAKPAPAPAPTPAPAKPAAAAKTTGKGKGGGAAAKPASKTPAAKTAEAAKAAGLVPGAAAAPDPIGHAVGTGDEAGGAPAAAPEEGLEDL